MANQEHLDIFKQGVGTWNRWREEHPDIEPDLSKVNLRGDYLARKGLQGVNLSRTDLQDVNLSETDLQDADLFESDLRGAYLVRTGLQGANLNRADLQGTHLSEADLQGAYLWSASFSNTTDIADITLCDRVYGPVFLVDVKWGGANLAVVDWTQMKMTGDARMARQSKTSNGRPKPFYQRLYEYRRAVRANRQLAVTLREQGLNEEGDHFAYHAQLLQRTVWRYQRKWLKLLLSWFLYLLAGYGYRPLRSLIIYLLAIIGFAVGYYEVTHLLHAQPYPLAWYEALILSISSFHGRGFFQPVQSLGDPVAILASVEAVIGLLIEISFIATFTQRFFSR